MWVMPLTLLTISALFLMACAGSAAPASPTQDTSTTTPTTANELRTGQTAMGIERDLEGIDIRIDECAWSQPDGGGDPEINVTFTLNNSSGEQLFTTYRLQNSSGTIYKKAGVGGDLTVNNGEPGARTLTTDKFDVGSEDIDLVVSIERFQDRTHETVPVGQCTGP